MAPRLIYPDCLFSFVAEHVNNGVELNPAIRRIIVEKCISNVDILRFEKPSVLLEECDFICLSTIIKNISRVGSADLDRERLKNLDRVIQELRSIDGLYKSAIETNNQLNPENIIINSYSELYQPEANGLLGQTMMEHYVPDSGADGSFHLTGLVYEPPRQGPEIEEPAYDMLQSFY